MHHTQAAEPLRISGDVNDGSAENDMSMSSEEARQTLTALEQLIAVAEWLGVRQPSQRAALRALRLRRTALKRLLTARAALAPRKVVPLAAWREPGKAASRTAAQSHRRVAAARTAAL